MRKVGRPKGMTVQIKLTPEQRLEFEKSQRQGIHSAWELRRMRILLLADNGLAKFNGLTDDKFFLHLKECEFRFNNRHENLEQKALKIMKKSGIC